MVYVNQLVTALIHTSIFSSQKNLKPVLRSIYIYINISMQLTQAQVNNYIEIKLYTKQIP